MNDMDMDVVRQEQGLPSYPAKEPVDIVSDYLSKVRAHVVDRIYDEFKNMGRDYVDKIAKELVITVPAVSIVSNDTINTTSQC